MNRDELKQLLTHPYNRDEWRAIISDIFLHSSFHAVPQDIPCDKEIIESFQQIGDVRLNDGKNLALFEIHVSDRVKLHQNRVELREIVARYIDQQTNHGVLVLFDSKSKDYRFTFAAKETEFTQEGELVERETATKRYTYILGPNEPCRTAAERFFELAQKKETAGLEDIIEAFSVEKLNKEFFLHYKEHYLRFTEFLLTSKYRKTVFKIENSGTEAEQTLAEKPIRDFAKKLLGRIVFLHYLQKKGWLGCPADRTEWSGGDKKFLFHSFQQCPDKAAFHSSSLIPLFHKALNKRNRPKDLFAITGTRVPYLNGGLFEEDLPEAREIDFPPDFFENLLDFFSQYNFTIDENDPEEHEVGIDPEMLGHLFENLLEDNKDKGAYYTPKAIVQYMCRQSLIEYLKSHLGDRKELEDLVHLKSRGNEHDRNNFILKNAREIETLLDNVKICDPAIGSGAFPIGLLQEIYWIKLTLDWTLDRAEVKRQIIQNSIYGVDIDAGAVEIARLRFWLALVVDEEEPRPLPNLDYKIMQGNSLLESFEGIRLDRILEPETMVVQELGTDQLSLNLQVTNVLHFEFNEKRRKDIGSLMNRYFSEIDPEQKARLHKEIDRSVLDHIDYNIVKQWEMAEHELALTETNIKDKQKQAKHYKPSNKESKKIDGLRTKISLFSKYKEKLHELEEKPERPFFLWQLYFQDVFEKGGFDIVIANPPYVRQETIKELKPALEADYSCYTGTADLFVYFYEKSVKLLKDNGVLTFITSNKYYRSGYGEKLREFLAKKLRIVQMIDFGDAPVFDAIAYASIIVGQKMKDAADHNTVHAYTWQPNDVLARLVPVLREKSFSVKQVELKPDGWRLESNEVMRLLEKLRAAGKPLGEYVKGRFYYGIKTGLNEAFVVDIATKDRLIEEDKSSEEVLKPFLRGRDVKRWRVESQDLWLIYIPWHFPYHLDNSISGPSEKAERDFKKGYPAIYKHLLKFKKELSERNAAETGIRYEWYALQRWGADYWKEFELPKVFVPAIADGVEYAVDKDGFYGNDKTSIIVSDESEYIAACLNSKILWWMIKTIAAGKQGGFYEFKPMYVTQLPIPAVGNEQIQKFKKYYAEIIQSPLNDVPQIENLINQEIFKLFNLTDSEIQLIESQQSKSSPIKVTSELRFLTDSFKHSDKHYIDIDTIKQSINTDSDSTLKTYLSHVQSSGRLYDAGKGWYSNLKDPFVLDTKPLKKIITLLEKSFPLLDFQCWSTAQINAYTQHMLAKHIAFVYTESDAINPVAENLRAEGYTVFANPLKAEVEKSFRVDEKTVVVRPSISKQPQGEGHFAPIEKILVDLVIEASALKFMDESEARLIVENATGAGRVMMSSLLGYAKRRLVDFSGIKTINQVQINDKYGNG
jgi:type I restriction-modification system DNA methylase subunit